jgi:hypothetical protein
MTKVWCQSLEEQSYTEARIAAEEWFAYPFSVFDCSPAPGASPEITLEISTPHPPADFFQPGTLFTVSDRLRAALEEFDVRTEFFPLRVLYGGAEYTERAFYFCNILDCVECLDLARGEYTFETKPGFTHLVHLIRKLAIDERKAAGHDLFRIANGGECTVCVSDRLASRIADGKLTAVRFVEPQDWHYGSG